MTFLNKIAPVARTALVSAVALGALGTLAAFAQEAAPAAADAAAAAPAAPAMTVDKGDIAWMLVSTVLVLFMTIPGLALFYGGLVRAKNMLSVLMQVLHDHRGGDDHLGHLGLQPRLHGGQRPFFGGLSKMFLAGVDVTTMAETFIEGVAIPELVFVCFQMTFAAITPAPDRRRLCRAREVLGGDLFTILWVTFVYFPIAHMVWFWGGPSARRPMATSSTLARSTSPAAPSSTSTPASPAWSVRS